MQCALRDRAIALGWYKSKIDVIDPDLGRNGATIEGRDGFKQLVAPITTLAIAMESIWKSPGLL